MNEVFIIIKVAFILLVCGGGSNTQAESSTLSCGLRVDQQYLGALPELSQNQAPLQGFQCQHTPKYSGFLGNWFPSSPSLTFSQSSLLLVNKHSSNSPARNDSNQTWNVSFSIKRFGRSQMSVFSGQKDWHKALKAKKNLTFIPSSAQSSSDGIEITQGQQALFNRVERYVGLSIIFPDSHEQTLTELRVQQTFINQAMQADIPLFNKYSLFPTHVNINEIIIISQSHHKGFNINWQFGLGKGNVVLKPKAITPLNSKADQIFSVRGNIELYYQYRLNRRWFTYLGWKGDFHYWRQSTDNNDVQLAHSSTLEQQVFLGVGLKF
jgi:hypothetical protein